MKRNNSKSQTRKNKTRNYKKYCCKESKNLLNVGRKSKHKYAALYVYVLNYHIVGE